MPRPKGVVAISPDHRPRGRCSGALMFVKNARPRGCEKIRFFRPQVFGVLRFFAAFTPTTHLYFLTAQACKTVLYQSVEVLCEP